MEVAYSAKEQQVSFILKWCYKQSCVKVQPCQYTGSGESLLEMYAYVVIECCRGGGGAWHHEGAAQQRAEEGGW